MKIVRFFAMVLAAVMGGSPLCLRSQDLVSEVQPMLGTASATTPSALQHGNGSEQYANTIPSVSTPFAMTQWTPQTRTTENKCISPYYYTDSLFSGLRGSHWLSGSCTQDYGSVTIMPVTGRLKTIAGDYQAPFTHADETSSPYEYAVSLRKYQVKASVTATSRCAVMKFTMEKADSLFLLVVPNSDYGEGYVKVDASRGEIYGYNPVHRIYQGWGKEAGFNGYFFIRIQNKTGKSGTFQEGRLYSADSISGKKNIGGYVGIKMSKGESLIVSVGTSFTSIEAAKRNLFAEIPVSDYRKVRQQCRTLWEQELSRVRIETRSPKQRHIFYTALYHAYQQPRLFSDVDGSYPKFASYYQHGKRDKGSYYDDFSLWDTYRAQIPLLEIVKPAMVSEIAASLLLKGDQGGWLPIFPCWNNYTSEMIGDHCISVIASAYLKGILKEDTDKAYALMRQNAFNQPSNKTDYAEGKGRRALESYLKYGYIPLEDPVEEAFHKKEQVSRTLEYAYDDFALALVAAQRGNKDDYQKLLTRASFYRNVFDPSVGAVRGRYTNGSWIVPFRKDVKESYITEGTPRQYTFYVPQDIAGLAQLMGGPDKLEQSLDSLFLQNEYWHGNEPGHHIPFLYNYTRAPYKTQQWVRWIIEREYSDGPGGLSGNDDAGQLSAWYLFASLGFYPVNPVSGEFMLCSPLFQSSIITLPQNKTFTIRTHRSHPEDLYIYEVKLNGKKMNRTFINYTDIVSGGILDVYLRKEPDKSWSAYPDEDPVSLRNIEKKIKGKS